jgi:prepilin-type processing-associated H-X9-DG protein
VSYLMPAHFQWWGTKYYDDPQNEHRIRLATHQKNPSFEIYAKTAERSWEVEHPTYKSKLGQIGSPSRKIAAADGTRYLDRSLILDFDPCEDPRHFGAFTSSGAWWCGSAAYGVRQGSLNWAGRAVDGGVYPKARGENLVLSYRHGLLRGGSAAARENRGKVNAMFFDGSVRRLDDRDSRNPVFWYPRGAVVTASGVCEGMTGDLEVGDEIP